MVKGFYLLTACLIAGQLAAQDFIINKIERTGSDVVIHYNLLDSITNWQRMGLLIDELRTENINNKL